MGAKVRLGTCTAIMTTVGRLQVLLQGVALPPAQEEQITVTRFREGTPLAGTTFRKP